MTDTDFNHLRAMDGLPQSQTVDHVSLVRVDTTWHVFTSTQTAWAFYDEWRDYRDCEFIGEIPVDVDES